MPRYDFRCCECGKEFELELSLRELQLSDSLKSCPFCASKNLKQQYNFSGGIMVKKGKNTVKCGGECGGGSCPFSK